MESSETPFDSLEPFARKAIVEALERERYGPMSRLEEERPTRYVLTELIATIAGSFDTPAATSSSPMPEMEASDTGARSVETSTPLVRMEEATVFESLDDLNTAYRKDAAFKHLRRNSNRFVPGDGPHPSPQLMLVGEAPGAKEQAMGRPFVGASGNMLTSMLWELRRHRKDCYVTNIVKYRPPNNRKPTPDEMEASTPYLRDEVQLVLPKGGLVILLGATALEVVDPEKRVLRDQGKPFTNGRWTFVPMAHPSYVLQGRMKRELYIAAWHGLLPLLPMPTPHMGLRSDSEGSTGSDQTA